MKKYPRLDKSPVMEHELDDYRYNRDQYELLSLMPTIPARVLENLLDAIDDQKLTDEDRAAMRHLGAKLRSTPPPGSNRLYDLIAKPHGMVGVETLRSYVGETPLAKLRAEGEID